MVAIESAVASLCEMLSAKIGVEVHLGRPEGGKPGIFVWPWKIDENPGFSNRPEPLPAAEVSGRQASTPVIHFFVQAEPPFTLESLSLLSRARGALVETPILKADGAEVQVMLNPLPADLLARVFSASSIPLTLCLSGTLSGARQQPGGMV
ncbi:MAG: DUF4255 domain-containing protein [Desulfobacterales bacterium]|nr:DUF4255 domain-containing protein [Desulfobacterales bacterium]